MGNTESVAKKHYLQVTDEHFARASGVTEADDQVAQNAAHQMRADAAQTVRKKKTGSPGTRCAARICADLRGCANWQIAEEGLETVDASSFGENNLRNFPFGSGAKCGALAATDPEIRDIVEALPDLPPAALKIIRSTIQAFLN